MLAICANSRGYYQVVLYFNNKQETLAVHFLVARAFLGERQKGMSINHIDGDKSNNRVENLEYCTPAENSKHACETGLMPKGEQVHNAKLTNADVLKIKARLANRERYVVICKDFGVHPDTIGDIARGRSWSHIK